MSGMVQIPRYINVEVTGCIGMTATFGCHLRPRHTENVSTERNPNFPPAGEGGFRSVSAEISLFFFFFFFSFNFLVNDGRAATMTDWGCLTLFGGEEKKKKRKEKPKSILIIHTKSVDITKLPQRETMRTRMHHHQAGGSSTSELISAGCPLKKNKKKKNNR